ncbi:polysaccharide pyruvyl transferase family protein [Myroides phaeus]|uniref:polysaccharide pyruvyl transferase family protein n=1 Tax=Myroides phaeus TaxID=702745 RepID=UPI002DBF5E43|nr:polysaccharide pyruvyl transferase family protein [Myroides phaeus]MEC4116372.1 polysaccharide pyruvyl transferase family protein [Myroides phaeus]
MNKKIGVLTLPAVSNYGGILQNYALQKVLKERGYDVITMERRFKRSNFKEFLSYCKNYTINRLQGSFYLKVSEKNKKWLYSEQSIFKKKYIKSSPLLYTTVALNDFIKRENIQTVIVGSDQVWRADYTPFLEDMFFCFLQSNTSVRKVGYAASFGKDTINYSSFQHSLIKNSLKEFSLVSVREDSGVRICRNEFEVNAYHVLDPTMLVKREEYINSFNLDINSKKRGVYYYLLDLDYSKKQLLDFLRGKVGKDVFCSQPKAFEGDKNTNLNDYKAPSIENWLQGFLDADFVVTDSFHGTVFSIIFNKPFYAIVNRSKGASRFESLLRMFDLEERLLDLQSCNLDDLNYKDEIDFAKVNEKLSKLQGESLELLLKSI